MRNVLQVMDYAAPYRGSFIESLDCLDQELRKAGSHLVYVFPPRARTNAAAKWIHEMAESGSKIYFLSGQLSKDIRLLRKIIADHRIGIIHTHFENFKTDLAVYLASLMADIKKVRHFRNHFKCDSALKKAAKRIVFRDCEFICVSESVHKDICREFPRNRSHAVENAIQYGRLDEFAQLRRSDFGIGERSILCFMMGFDFKRKGVDLAINAIQALRAQHDVRLMISVSSNLDAVKQSIEQQVGTMPDWIVLVPPRNDIASYYKMADVFISASREEGFCNALVEAAYCERMVIASRIPAQGELKIPHAFWFEPGDAEDLKSKLVEAIARKEEFGRELRAAKVAVERSYDLHSWVQKIVSIYQTASPHFAPSRTGRTQPV